MMIRFEASTMIVWVPILVVQLIAAGTMVVAFAPGGYPYYRYHSSELDSNARASVRKVGYQGYRGKVKLS